jgi:hypothetical protein
VELRWWSEDFQATHLENSEQSFLLFQFALEFCYKVSKTFDFNALSKAHLFNVGCNFTYLHTFIKIVLHNWIKAIGSNCRINNYSKIHIIMLEAINQSSLKIESLTRNNKPPKCILNRILFKKYIISKVKYVNINFHKAASKIIDNKVLQIKVLVVYSLD